MTKIATTDHPVHTLIANRFSPYGFSDRAVSPADLASLFEAARWTASSYNEQPWSYLVATKEDEEAFAKMLSCLVEGNQGWARNAPVLAIGVITKEFTRNGKPNKAAAHDLGAASTSLSLEATARGLSVHQMIGIEPERVHELYGLPEAAEAFTGLAIGYAAEDFSGLDEKLRERDEAPRSRKPLEDFVFADRFGKSAKLG